MCTAISLTSECNYFGRNLDYDREFDQKVIITPRKFPFTFKDGETIDSHSAIIGMGISENNYPLYFDATNESGLSIAGLNFPGNAEYFSPKPDKFNIASYEFIPWVLLKCKTALDAKKLIENTNITDDSFMPGMSPAPLHWLISDKNYSITAEQTKDGMRVYDNPVGVLTNNPSFYFHMTNLSNYMGVSPKRTENRFSKKIIIPELSTGMGTIGLPGDMSSCSRFIRTAFLKLNLVFSKDENEAVNQFFHLLYSSYHQKGTVETKDGYEITYYSSCCNTDRGIYYYTTYESLDVGLVNIADYDLDTQNLYICNLLK